MVPRCAATLLPGSPEHALIHAARVGVLAENLHVLILLGKSALSVLHTESPKTIAGRGHRWGDPDFGEFAWFGCETTLYILFSLVVTLLCVYYL